MFIDKLGKKILNLHIEKKYPSIILVNLKYRFKNMWFSMTMFMPQTYSIKDIQEANKSSNSSTKEKLIDSCMDAMVLNCCPISNLTIIPKTA